MGIVWRKTRRLGSMFRMLTQSWRNTYVANILRDEHGERTY